MEKKLNILQLSPRFPFPEDDGGKIGIANIFKEFSNQGFEVTLFSYTCDDDKKNLHLAKKYGQLFTLDLNTSNSPLNIFKALITNKSLYIQKHFSKKAESILLDIIKERQIDVIHADHSGMGALGLNISKKTGIPLGIRMHNVESTIWERYAHTFRNYHPKGILLRHQANLLRKYEAYLFENSDINFAITEDDLIRGKSIAPNGRFIVAGAGVNLKEWDPPIIEKYPYTLILATTYHWIHNVDAVRWLIEKVIPIVKEKYPDLKLILLGKNPPDWLKGLEKENIFAVGYVDDVKPYLSKASVYVAPLFVGGGIRIKILEAMALELPVIATSVSAEGINANQNDGLFIADSVDQFADTISKLLSDNKIRSESGKAARKFIAQNFSWKENVGKMINEYQRIKSTPR